VPIAFALLSSLLWGSGDFLGGRATRRLPVLVVLAVSQVAMLVLLWIVIGVLVAGGRVEVDAASVGVAMLGGAAGVIGLGAFYRALANGPMSVVPPIAAAGVALPVTVGIATGGTPASAVVVAGLALAIAGVVLASVGEGTAASEDAPVRVSATTLALCIVAACGFGLIFVAMDHAAGDSAAGALVATGGVRLGSCLLLALTALAVRARPWHGATTPRVALGLVTIGLFDTGANLSFAVAAAYGELAVVAVVGSLYPAVTSGLAHVLLGERLGRLQLVGVACALAGVALLALR
jgi:uncharacterized membrane protein